MRIEDYAQWTDATAVYPKSIPPYADERIVSLLYVGCKLPGEAGEVSDKIGKLLRDNGGQIPEEKEDEIIGELGDVFWYAARICRILGRDPREVLERNMEKLESRKSRGMLQGDGDNR